MRNNYPFCHWLFLLSLFLLISCENKEYDYGFDEYKEEFAVALSKTEFLTDNGEKLIHTGKEITRSFNAGDRLYLHYTLLPEEKSGYDHTVRVNGFAIIPSGQLKPVSDADIKKLPSEPILLESVWIGSHFLNMQFYLEYHSQSHEIGLVADSVKLKNNEYDLYFSHDSKNDPAGYYTHSFLSFDLEKSLGQPAGDKKLNVVISTSNYGNKTYELNY